MGLIVNCPKCGQIHVIDEICRPENIHNKRIEEMLKNLPTLETKIEFAKILKVDIEKFKKEMNKKYGKKKNKKGD